MKITKPDLAKLILDLLNEDNGQPRQQPTPVTSGPPQIDLHKPTPTPGWHGGLRRKPEVITDPADSPALSWEKIALAVSLGLLPAAFVLPSILAKKYRGTGTSNIEEGSFTHEHDLKQLIKQALTEDSPQPERIKTLSPKEIRGMRANLFRDNPSLGTVPEENIQDLLDQDRYYQEYGQTMPIKSQTWAGKESPTECSSGEGEGCELDLPKTTYINPYAEEREFESDPKFVGPPQAAVHREHNTMKTTKHDLKQLIREELYALLNV